MSVVQAIFAPHSIGNYPCPEFTEALLTYAFDRFEIAYWNFHQHGWERDGNPISDPFEYRSFRYPEFNFMDEDLNEEQLTRKAVDDIECARPNFAFEGIEFRWYKRFGRGMSVNVRWQPDSWVAWFERLLAAIKGYDSCGILTPEHLWHHESGERVHERDCQPKITPP